MKIIENTNAEAEAKDNLRVAQNSGRYSAKSIQDGRSQNNGSKSVPDMNWKR